MPVLRFNNICVEAILHSINLSLQAGEMMVVLGPNGAGKTTLFRAALGLVKSAGTISIDDSELSKLSTRERASKIACLPQDAPWLEPVSALDAVVSGRYRFNETLAESQEHAVKALCSAGAEAFASRAITSLSGGERQRVHMAIALAQDTPWLLLDEPANHLDPAQQREISLLIKSLWRSGKGIIAIVHDVNILRWLGDPKIRIVGLADGKLVFDCRYEDPALSTHLSGLFNIPFGSVEVDGQTLYLPMGKA